MAAPGDVVVLIDDDGGEVTAATGDAPRPSSFKRQRGGEGRGRPAAVVLLDDDGGGSAGHSAAAPGAAATEDGAVVEVLPPREVREEQWRARLKAALLSPACSTEGVNVVVDSDPRPLRRPEIEQIMRDHVPNLDSYLDRRRQMTALELIVMTYESGLPLFASDETSRAHSRNALRVILDRIGTIDPRDARRHLTRLCEGFGACQAVQARSIDAIYNQLTGRTLSLRDQVLVTLVDDQKQRVLDETCYAVSPTSHSASDGHPTQQMPHLQSALKMAMGNELGLRGVQAARADYCAPRLAGDFTRRAVAAFRERFDVNELVNAFMADVNAQDPTVERYVDRDALATWAGTAGAERGLAPHSIFFDDSTPERYGGSRPTEANAYQPFLHYSVALEILALLLA